MLTIFGEFKAVKHLKNDKTNLLVQFNTKMGKLEFVINNDTWMKYFIQDSQPHVGSFWKLKVQAIVVPELNKTMLSLESATKATKENSNQNAILSMLERIDQHIQELKDLGMKDNSFKISQPAIDKNEVDDTNTDNDEDDLTSMGDSYSPTLDDVTNDKPEAPIEVTDKPEKHHFSMATKEPEKKDPEQEAVQQGSGDSITNSFFSDDSNDTSTDDESSETDQEKQAKEEEEAEQEHQTSLSNQEANDENDNDVDDDVEKSTDGPLDLSRYL